MTLSLGKRPMKVHYFLTIDRLKAAINEVGNPLPAAATELLIERGFLGIGGNFGQHNWAPPEDLAAFNDAMYAACTQFAAYCQQSQIVEYTVESLQAFLAFSNKLAGSDNGLDSQSQAMVSSARFFLEILADGAPPQLILKAAQAQQRNY